MAQQNKPPQETPLDNRAELSRRDVVSMIIAALVATALAGVASLSVVFRYLRPKLKPFNVIQPLDEAQVGDQVVATLGELQNPWDYRDFIFRQVNIEYTPRGQQETQIPGFAVKLPADATMSEDGDAEHMVYVVSRICPHLGCIFNFETDPATVNRNYGGFTPPGPVFACPCHLSIYNPEEAGAVISGPAPRPPYPFPFEVQGESIVITGPPAGLA